MATRFFLCPKDSIEVMELHGDPSEICSIVTNRNHLTNLLVALPSGNICDGLSYNLRLSWVNKELKNGG